MGAVFRIPVILSPCLAEALSEMKHRFGTRVVSTDPHARTTIHDTPLTGNLCVVLGNEDEGVSTDVSALADERAAVPMCNRTDSLNVGSASAVFLYEANRQRWRSGAPTSS